LVSSADTDPAFYLNADPDPGSQTKAIHADPELDPGQTLSHKKLNFFMKNLLSIGTRSKKPTKVQKPF
jgi:hypothetical protein